MAIRIHNRRRTPEYGVWGRTCQSCYNKNSPSYKNIGGAGIKMFEEWRKDCVSFMDYIGPRPQGRFFFDRYDRSKDFEPGNVFWSDKQYSAWSPTHGLSKSSEHNIWGKIKTRCYNSKCPEYVRYGGRGILMFDAWRGDFLAFYKYIGPRPSKRHSIDRIDNDKGYEPGNVRWATDHEQTRNKRSNINIQICCQTKILEDWCRIHRVTRKVVTTRIKKGWDVLSAFGLKPSPDSYLRSASIKRPTSSRAS